MSEDNNKLIELKMVFSEANMVLKVLDAVIEKRAISARFSTSPEIKAVRDRLKSKWWDYVNKIEV